MHRRLAILSAACLLGWSRPAAAVDITECGQVVRAGEVGELTTDLDCGPSATWPFAARGVYLDNGATLDLNGHAIRSRAGVSGVGVACGAQSDPPSDGPCTVNGTGEISGWEIGLNGGGCTFVVRDVTIRANKTGILAVLSCDVDLANVVVSDNLGDGVAAYNVTARDVRASNNGALGIRSLRGLTAERLTATGNGLEGVLGGGARTLLVDSVVTRNAAAMDKLDVSAAGPLRLVDTECGRAARIRWKRIRGQGDRYRKVIVRRVRCAPVS